jgi:ribosomal protein L20A (L18A)
MTMPVQILKSAPPKAQKSGKPFRTFRLNHAVDAKLAELAKRHGLSRSEVLRQAIDYVYNAEFGIVT